MAKANTIIRHIVISLSVLIFLLGLLKISFSFLEKVLINPENYLRVGLSASEVQLMLISIFLVTICVLISYTIYLLLASKTRTELTVQSQTRWLTISREQFRRVYEGAPVPYITLGPNGEIKDQNNSALQFFGALPEEINGKKLLSFCSPTDEEIGQKISKNYELGIPINREEVRFITKKGKEKWTLISIFEIKNPLSKEHAGLATIFDITEQKLLDQAKTEFVSLASHQLRAPLATIKWYADMLLSGDLGEVSEKQKEYVSKIFQVNREMIDLVNTLLNVSRIEMGSLEIDIKPTNVREISESILFELSPQIEEKQIEIEKQYNEFLENINSDPKLLRIILQNLISNAVKYTPQNGKITIDFEQTPVLQKITVSDTGLGIPKELQSKVFSKLFRADNVKELVNSPGTGLGLYLVKSIVNKLGGKINFTSEENKGSSFSVTF